MQNKETNNMKTTPIKFLLAAAVLLSTLSPQLSTAFAQGSLTPPGPPAPTMKTLQQVEPRTPISSLPVTITQPGSYYLTSSFDLGAGQDGIFVSAINVTIDLNGFTIRSFDPGNTAVGIRIDPLGGYMSDLTILNGHIVGSVLNVGGVYSGSGFGYGIYCAGSLSNVHISGVTVSGCLLDGINVGGNSTLVESCAISTVGGNGIFADSVSHCTAYQCGGNGINANTASDCHGSSSSNYGLIATTAHECYGSSSSGYGLYASAADNCYGSSAGSYGLLAGSGNNCYGASNSGIGESITSANNCSGTSYGGGDGLDADVANNCYGQSYSGTGLFAYYSASNCYGFSYGGGYGVRTYYMAIGCYGYSSSGTGLNAYIGNSSYGSTESVTLKYNMP